MIQLRKYQRNAVDSIYHWFHARSGNPLVVLPTGAGKSVVMAAFVHEALTRWPGTRILLVSHVKELLVQNAEKIIKVWPGAPLGFFSASLGRKDADARILVAGIQSIWKHADRVGGADLVLVDECHLISHKTDTTYRIFIKDLLAINPDTKFIGFTATPYRLNTGLLYEGEGSMFDGVCYQADMGMLVKEEFLCRLSGRRGATTVDLTGVHVRAGEFVEEEMAERFDRTEVTEAAVREILALSADRMGLLVFCSGVDHAAHVAAEFIRQGEPRTASITGSTPRAERDRLVQEFKSGRVRVITNCNVLTTGFDAPNCDVIAFLRATQSPGLYVQMMGRGMRLNPGKANCLVLDYGGNIDRHGPVDSVEMLPRKAGREPQAAPVKECPDCMELVHLSVRVCPNCGHEFPPSEKPQHATSASDAPVMSDDVETVVADVQAVFYSKHEKEGKTPSMRVDYRCGLRTFSEWVCFEHAGYARRKAESWAMMRGEKPPATVDEALNVQWVPTKRIRVKPVGRYPEILGYELMTQEEADAAFLAELEQEQTPEKTF